MNKYIIPRCAVELLLSGTLIHAVNEQYFNGDDISGWFIVGMSFIVLIGCVSDLFWAVFTTTSDLTPRTKQRKFKAHFPKMPLVLRCVGAVMLAISFVAVNDVLFAYWWFAYAVIYAGFLWLVYTHRGFNLLTDDRETL